MVKKNSKKKEGILKKEISRRDLIKTTALGAAGLSLSSWVPVPLLMERNRRLRSE